MIFFSYHLILQLDNCDFSLNTMIHYTKYEHKSLFSAKPKVIVIMIHKHHDQFTHQYSGDFNKELSRANNKRLWQVECKNVDKRAALPPY